MFHSCSIFAIELYPASPLFSSPDAAIALPQPTAIHHKNHKRRREKLCRFPYWMRAFQPTSFFISKVSFWERLNISSLNKIIFFFWTQWRNNIHNLFITHINRKNIRYYNICNIIRKFTVCKRHMTSSTENDPSQNRYLCS